MCARKMKRKFL